MSFYDRSFKKMDHNNTAKKDSLPEYERNTIKIIFAPMKNLRDHHKRTAVCTCLRASLTVEAAIALPVFVMCLTACICVVRIFGAFTMQTICLQQSVEEKGMYMTETSGDGIIRETARVSYLPDWCPFTSKIVEETCIGRVHAWTGRLPSDTFSDTQKSDGDRLVYVTDYKSVYHTSSQCSHLHLQIKRVSASAADSGRNIYGGKYHACEKCVGHGQENALVYITEQGDRYHNALGCSGLTRTVKLVKKSEVEGLSVCSRCAAMELQQAS